MHFARWNDGTQTKMPIIGGQRGPEITRSLLEIEETFNKSLNILIVVEKTILDVKNTSWHEEFSRFRTAVKELEVMVQNLIQSAFDTVRSVDEGRVSN
jgi:dynein heavy chain